MVIPVIRLKIVKVGFYYYFKSIDYTNIKTLFNNFFKAFKLIMLQNKIDNFFIFLIILIYNYF